MPPCRFPCASERPPRRTILLVEDEPFVREATCRILQVAGFHVLPAADANEAMQVYEQQGRRIDLVMSDMVLPGRSGRQLGQDLRRFSAEIPVLLTSGYAEAGCEAASLEAGTYYLPKPYSRSALLAKIAQILDGTQLRNVATQAG